MHAQLIIRMLQKSEDNLDESSHVNALNVGLASHFLFKGHTLLTLVVACVLVLHSVQAFAKYITWPLPGVYLSFFISTFGCEKL